MTYDKTYFPYPSTDTIKKYFIITNQGKKIRFGAKSYDHFTEGHLDEEIKQRYLNRHKKERIVKTRILLVIGLRNSYGFILLIKKHTQK